MLIIILIISLITILSMILIIITRESRPQAKPGVRVQRQPECTFASGGRKHEVLLR